MVSNAGRFSFSLYWDAQPEPDDVVRHGRNYHHCTLDMRHQILRFVRQKLRVLRVLHSKHELAPSHSMPKPNIHIMPKTNKFAWNPVYVTNPTYLDEICAHLWPIWFWEYKTRGNPPLPNIPEIRPCNPSKHIIKINTTENTLRSI